MIGYLQDGIFKEEMELFFVTIRPMLIKRDMLLGDYFTLMLSTCASLKRYGVASNFLSMILSAHS